MHALAIALVLAALPMLAHGARIYQCESAPGKVEFRDTPCPGGGGSVTEIKPTPPASIAKAEANLEHARREAAALTERLNARTAAAYQRVVPYYVPVQFETPPAIEPIGYPLAWSCNGGSACGSGYRPIRRHHAAPSPLPPRTISIPAPTPLRNR